jgi:hypothetical protein
LIWVCIGVEGAHESASAAAGIGLGDKVVLFFDLKKVACPQVRRLVRRFLSVAVVVSEDTLRAAGREAPQSGSAARALREALPGSASAQLTLFSAVRQPTAPGKCIQALSERQPHFAACQPNSPEQLKSVPRF